MLRRTTKAGHSGAQSVTPAPEQRQLRINDLILAVISWRALLDVIGGALERAGDAVRAADVRQLCGLCEKMDTDAFLLFLPTGVERDAVVAHALAQLDRVVTALPSVGEGVSIVAEPTSEIANGEGDGGIAQ
ncbi:MAG: hypothetical protein Q8O86_06155 [Dehalococcoidia bacterium]|nr:hypothetical protein [Dehalococcoidia bacterium]